MKTTTKKLGFVCATALAFALVCPTAVHATEPLDNTPPWGTVISGGYIITTQNVTEYVSNTSTGLAAWGDGADRQISPSGDVDYAVLQCGKLSSFVSQGKISSVQIGYNQAAGDLDIQVFDPTGVYLGGSFGVSGSETVNVSSLGLDSVIIKIYGYAGGTGGYSLAIYCQ